MINEEYQTEMRSIRMSIPLLMKLLEYAREESTSDVDLHWIVERIILFNDHNYSLTMAFYQKIVPEDRLVTVELEPGQKIEVENIDEKDD